jgi:hypothetical protein
MLASPVATSAPRQPGQTTKIGKQRTIRHAVPATTACQPLISPLEELPAFHCKDRKLATVKFHHGVYPPYITLAIFRIAWSRSV